MSSLELIRQALVELVDDMNGENPDNVDSQAAATNICNMVLADVKPEEAGNASSHMPTCPSWGSKKFLGDTNALVLFCLYLPRDLMQSRHGHIDALQP